VIRYKSTNTSILSVLAAVSTYTCCASNYARANDAAEAGRKVFEVCAFCHSAEYGKNGIGPTMWGVFGRSSATLPDYDYSEGMKKFNVIWDDAALNAFLSSPMEVVQGTKMTYSGLESSADRENIIAYLRTLRKD
jgi:cytochrome c